MKEVEGILEFFSETGTEGGYWAIQDKKDISLISIDSSYKGRIVYDSSDHNRKGEILEKINEKASLVKWTDEEVSVSNHSNLLVERWDYQGLNYLTDGDYLVIYDKLEPEKVVWEGEINLNQFKLFDESVFGFWIHNEQIGISRTIWANWFFGNYPAKMIRKEGTDETKN